MNCVYHSEVVEKFPNLRGTITSRLTQTFAEIKSGKVFRGALWIVGEYCSKKEGVSIDRIILNQISHVGLWVCGGLLCFCVRENLGIWTWIWVMGMV